jgi:hypothetical protein
MTLELGPYQAMQLARYLEEYRAYAWRELAPSPERNQALRVAQSIQGRVAAWRGETQRTLLLEMSEEEQQTTRQVLVTLTRVAQLAFPSPQRQHTLSELAAFRLLLARCGHSTREWPEAMNE